MTSLLAADSDVYRRATWAPEGRELIEVLVFHGAGAAFGGSFLYVSILAFQTEQQPYFAAAGVIGSLYLIVLCIVRALLPYLRRSLALDKNGVTIGSAPIAQRIPYAAIEEVWTAPNTILHTRDENPWPPGVLLRIRTAARLYEIPLLYGQVDACAVKIWQRSRAVYWDMHGRKNPPPGSPAPRSRAWERKQRLLNALPHALVVLVLAAFAVASSLLDKTDSTVQPPPPMAPLAIVGVAIFAGPAIWQTYVALKRPVNDITS